MQSVKIQPIKVTLIKDEQTGPDGVVVVVGVRDEGRLTFKVELTAMEGHFRKDMKSGSFELNTDNVDYLLYEYRKPRWDIFIDAFIDYLKSTKVEKR